MANGTDNTPTEPGKANLGALATAAGALLTFVGSVSLTGPLGRVIRNDGEPLEWAMAAVLIGAALLIAAGLSSTGKLLEVIFSLLGLILTLAGFIIATVLAIRSADHQQRPSITAALDESGRSVTGKVTVQTLPSNARVVTVVQGVTEGASGRVDRARDLERSDVGPNDDGKVDIEFATRLPAGRYDALRIAAWTVDAKHAQQGKNTDDADLACRLGKGLPKAEDAATAAGKACVKLPLLPVPAIPGLQAHWTSTRAEEIEVQVTSNNASAPLSVAEGGGSRIGIVVQRKAPDGGYAGYYRAILRPDAEGKLDTKFKVPVAPGPRRICVAAVYLAPGASPNISCRGTLDDFVSDQAVVHLSRPKPDPAPDPW